MLRPEQNLPCNDRTSAAEAVYAQKVYGTAEAVPFVQRLACRKSNLDKPDFQPSLRTESENFWVLLQALPHRHHCFELHSQ
jgi:hypothetical protein